jgi:hypothetical protein
MWIITNKIDKATYGPFETGWKAWEWQETMSSLLSLDDVARHKATWSTREVQFTETAYDAVLHTTAWTFGPGKLESIELKMWRDESVKVVGGYPIYCGNGTCHEFAVDSGIIDKEDWYTYVGMARSLHIKLDDDDIRYDAVSQIIEEILDEEWSDPCEVGPDIEEPLPCPVKSCIVEGLNGEGELKAHLEDEHTPQEVLLAFLAVATDEAFVALKDERFVEEV